MISELSSRFDLFQFAYRLNHSAEDAISSVLHLTLQHLEEATQVRMLLVDFSSTFNTIIPKHLVSKLSTLGINTTLQNSILDFLTDRPQVRHVVLQYEKQNNQFL